MSSIYRALGVRSAINPNYRTSDFAPVAIVADMSRSFASEQFEGRRLWGQSITNPGAPAPASTTELQFHSRAAGGMVIEHLEIATVPAVWRIYVGITSTATPGPWFNIGTMEVGGQVTTSTGHRQFDTATPPPWAGLNVVLDTSYWNSPTDRIFVPAGSFYRVQCNLGAVGAFTTHVVCLAREIPEIAGAP